MALVRVARWRWLAMGVPTALLAACGTVLDVSTPADYDDAGALADAQREADGAAAETGVAVDALASKDAPAQPDGAGVDLDAEVDAAEDAAADANAQVDAAADADAQVDAQAPDAGGGVTCAGVCVAPVADWNGPFVLITGTGSTAPSCSSPLPDVVFAGKANLQVPPSFASNCSPCTCGTPSNVSCGNATFFSAAPACTEVCSDLGNVISRGAGCLNLSGLLMDCQNPAQNAPFTRVSPAVPTGGSCTPSSVVASPPTISWGIEAVGCKATNAPGCASGSTCLPGPDARRCISRLGNNDCTPLQPYTIKRVFYDGFLDSRGCTACQCSAPKDGTCATTVTRYNSANCLGTTDVPVAAPGCVGLAGSMRLDIASPSGVTCSPSGGMPDGNVIETGALTVCCTQ